MIIFIGVKIETTKNDNDLDLGKHKKICVLLLTKQKPQNHLYTALSSYLYSFHCISFCIGGGE